MGWTRKPLRSAGRKQHRPDLESLELRALLNASPLALGTPRPATTAYSGSPTNFDSLIGASAARNQYNVNGTGMTVAVIDAGVNYKNQALGGGFGPGHKVVAGFDFADNSPDPISSSVQHGTAVAGLIASSDPNGPGIAPGADIVSLRVFNSSDQGDFVQVANALKWVIDNHDKYNITVVNLSLSDGNNYARNWFAQDGGIGQRITSLIGQLDTLNIPVVAATGNSFNGQQGEGFVSIIPDTISVTSSDGSDQLVGNAQRLGSAVGGASATDIAAPGVGLNAPADGNNFDSVSGTSFATPLVSGALVLLQQVYESRFGHLPSVSDLDSWLQAGSDPIHDGVTGITIGRLDIPKAIAQIPNPAAQVLIPPPTSSTPSTSTPAPGSTSSGGTTTTPSTPTNPGTPTTPVDTLTPPTPPAPTTPTPAPPPPPPTTPSAPTSSLNLWLNGQQITQADLNGTGGKLSGLPALFQQALRSLQSWWGGADGQSTVQVWAAAPSPGSTRTAGVLEPLAGVTKAHATAAPKAVQPVLHAHRPAAPTMPRAWHSFATRSRTR